MDNSHLAGNDDYIEGEERFSQIPCSTLEPMDGTCHIILAQGEGALAVLDLAKKTSSDFWQKTHLAYVPDNIEPNRTSQLQDLNPRWFYEWPTLDAALPHVRELFANAKQGNRLYVTGTHSFIGIIFQQAHNAGIDPYEALAERRGPKTRRIQCVHCKGFMDNVATQPVTCSHCGVLLLVRGHYSRRLAAYQGVCINAEDTSEIPETKELFS
jgi:hypothetical protein